MQVHERFHRALELLDIQGTERCLELGSGAGLLAGLVAARLQEGKITMVDRSEAMIRAALKRNAAFATAGKLDAVCCSITELRAHRQRYDRIFAFNVNVFLENAAEEWEITKMLLAPGGRLCLFSQPPYDKTLLQLEALLEGLNAQSCTVLASGREVMGGAMACYVIARA